MNPLSCQKGHNGSFLTDLFFSPIEPFFLVYVKILIQILMSNEFTAGIRPQDGLALGSGLKFISRGPTLRAMPWLPSARAGPRCWSALSISTPVLGICLLTGLHLIKALTKDWEMKGPHFWPGAVVSYKRSHSLKSFILARGLRRIWPQDPL